MDKVNLTKIPTRFAVLPGKSGVAVADIAVHAIATGSFVLTRIWLTLIDIFLKKSWNNKVKAKVSVRFYFGTWIMSPLN